MGDVTLAYRDYAPAGEDGEIASFSFKLGTTSAANYDNQVTAMNAVITAFNAATRAVHARTTFTALIDEVSSANASDVDAQREVKMLVRYSDDITAKKYRIEMPCPDLPNLTVLGRDRIELADGSVMAALVAALEANIVAPDTGNAITVLSATIVGRNN